MCEILMRVLHLYGGKPFLIYRRTVEMAGTKEGGMKSKAKNLAKDPEFYAKIGAKGGKKVVVVDLPLIQN